MHYTRDGVSQDSYCISTWGCFTGKLVLTELQVSHCWACYGSTDLPISVGIWADEGRGAAFSMVVWKTWMWGNSERGRVWWNDMGPRGLLKGSYGQRGTLGKLICDLLSQACYRVAWESSSKWRQKKRKRRRKEIRMKQTHVFKLAWSVETFYITFWSVYMHNFSWCIICN